MNLKTITIYKLFKIIFFVLYKMNTITNILNTQEEQIKEIINTYLTFKIKFDISQEIKNILNDIQGVIYYNKIKLNRNLREFNLIGDEFLNKFNKLNEFHKAKYFEIDSFKIIKINDYEIILYNKYITIKINNYYNLILNTCLNLAKVIDINFYYLTLIKNLIEKEYLNKIDNLEIYLNNDSKLLNKIYPSKTKYLSFIKSIRNKPFKLIELNNNQLKCDVLTAFTPEMSGNLLNEIKLKLIEIDKLKHILNNSINKIIRFEYLTNSNEIIIRVYMSYPYRKHNLTKFNLF